MLGYLSLSRVLPVLPDAGRALHHFRRMSELRRQRDALGRLDPHLLRDIGLDPGVARREATRPFWDAPAHWRS